MSDPAPIPIVGIEIDSVICLANSLGIASSTIAKAPEFSNDLASCSNDSACSPRP